MRLNRPLKVNRKVISVFAFRAFAKRKAFTIAAQQETELR